MPPWGGIEQQQLEMILEHPFSDATLGWQSATKNQIEQHAC